MTGLRVVEWGFRNAQLEGYFARNFDPAVLAIQEDLRPETRRARELEAEGYDERPLAFKWHEKACYAIANVTEVDMDAVRALRPRIEREEPGWVKRVKKEWEGFRDVESVAFWAEVPIQAVVAILLNLDERGSSTTTTTDDRPETKQDRFYLSAGKPRKEPRIGITPNRTRPQ